MKVTSKVFGMCLAMALCLPLHAGKVYKWQDEDGAWHYSATPPPDHSAETIKTRSYSNSGSENNTPPANPGSDNRKHRETQKSAEVATEDQALAEENCRKAKMNLENLKRGSRLRIKDPETGEVRYLSVEEQQEWVERSEKIVEENCR